MRSGQNARSAQPAPALAEESGCGRMRRTGSCLGGCSSQQARVFALLHFRTGLNEPTVLALPATAPPRPVSGRFVAGFSKHSSAAHRPWSGIKLFAPSPLCSRPGFPPFSSPAHPALPGKQRWAACPRCPWPRGHDDPPRPSLHALLCSSPSVSPRPALPTACRPVQPRLGNSLAQASDRLLMSPSMVPCTWFVD